MQDEIHPNDKNVFMIQCQKYFLYFDVLLKSFDKMRYKDTFMEIYSKNIFM